MATVAVVTAKHAALICAAGIGVFGSVARASLEGFALGALLAGVCFAALTARARGGAFLTPVQAGQGRMARLRSRWDARHQDLAASLSAVPAVPARVVPAPGPARRGRPTGLDTARSASPADVRARPVELPVRTAPPGNKGARRSLGGLLTGILGDDAEAASLAPVITLPSARGTRPGPRGTGTRTTGTRTTGTRTTGTRTTGTEHPDVSFWGPRESAERRPAPLRLSRRGSDGQSASQQRQASRRGAPKHAAPSGRLGAKLASGAAHR